MEHSHIQQLENSLSLHNTRTMSLIKFVDYLKARYIVEDALYGYYGHDLYRVHKWWTFGRTQKSEINLVKNIKEKFGDGCVLAYGDWSSPVQIKGTVSSPTVGLRRMLSKHFTVIDVPEYNTTKTCCKCNEPLMKAFLYRKRRRKKEEENEDAKAYPVRGIRRCQNEECGVIVNRDYNAAINIRLNLLNHIKNGDWCERFKRKNNVRGSDDVSSRQDLAVSIELVC